MFDMEKDQIVFIAKHKEWVAIKKLLIDELAKPEDVSLILAQVQKSINEKSYKYAGIDTEKISAYAASLAIGKKKGVANLAQIFAEIKPAQLKKDLLEMCASAEQYPLVEGYFITSLCENIGYTPYPNIEVLQKVFPDLKVAKPRGNFGKKKK